VAAGVPGRAAALSHWPPGSIRQPASGQIVRTQLHSWAPSPEPAFEDAAGLDHALGKRGAAEQALRQASEELMERALGLDAALALFDLAEFYLEEKAPEALAGTLEAYRRPSLARRSAWGNRPADPCPLPRDPMP